ncbi:MAG: ribosome small subunit-dependent GTPase A [Paracoccaceae bacterium]
MKDRSHDTGLFPFLAALLRGPIQRKPSTLERLGWQSVFAQQTDIDELARTPPVRVVEVHRNGLHVLGQAIDATLPPNPEATVGDWLLYDAGLPGRSRLLERKSLIRRRAPGTDRQVQLIAANLDTAFIVTSCNHDFNVARLERFVALAFEAGVAPVILLTKPDLCPEAEREGYEAAAGAISDRVPVIAVNARGGEAAAALADYTRPGQTVAFLGSSGVGKSTLVNALAGVDAVATQAIREDDSKGRHTTTRRQLHLLPGGCAVLDTPGMRELQLTEARAGIAELFQDLDDLAATCRFRDCRHESEPGCAVKAAMADGRVEAARVERWRKLAREEAFNSATLAERKAKDRALSRLVREAQKRDRD